MSDLVFSIKNIFNIDPKIGVLGKYQTEKYYIAPYQRGYKWRSLKSNDAVCLLLTDMHDAFEGDEEEYYLQYITVKKNNINSTPVLEVIDGQQRLMTLTLLLAVMAYNHDYKISIAEHKLKYGVRESVDTFLEDFIYGDISVLEKTTNWLEFTEQYPQYDIQDIYYMFQAVKYFFSSEHLKDSEIFYEYVLGKVKLILNLIDNRGSMTSEKLFSNLNTNKVDLTSTELVKGLLLTRAGREKDDDNSNRHFKEILELRAAMGRQWDEISTWCERSDIKSFYFDNSLEPMDKLLNFVALDSNYHPETSVNKYDLFNFFQSKIKKNKIQAKTLFSNLRVIFLTLKDWYEDPRIHNLIGYLLAYKYPDKNSAFQCKELVQLLQCNKTELRKNLGVRIFELLDIDSGDIKKWKYGESDIEIYNALLLVNVFLSEEQFNFMEFSRQKWSLEHIFPQTPSFLPERLVLNDLELINKLLQADWKEKIQEKLGSEAKISQFDIDSTTLEAKLQSNSCTLTCEEKEILYACLKKENLHSIGNMALLTSSDNSSNTNGLFDAKRHNIVSLVSTGSFVPKHTYDVFSKLLSDAMDPDLRVWSEQDIIAHENWLKAQILTIVEEMTK